MCGIAGIAGADWSPAQLERVADAQVHRGPDDRGVFIDGAAGVGLTANRLSIVDLTPTGHQPMSNPDGSVQLVLNGEIYNHLELRTLLRSYPFRGHSDSEVLLAAYEQWGPACLDRLFGMFAFAIWDGRTRRLFCGRDRFGVKPLYYCHDAATGRLIFASEIKAIAAAGVAMIPDPETWRQYLAFGLQEHSARTFFLNVRSLPGGHSLTWQAGQIRVERWYDLPSAVLSRFPDERPEGEVEEEYLALLDESIRLRLRADVAVGVALSGGLDSALLLALVQRSQGPASRIPTFTFSSDDSRYDESPWVRELLRGTRHRWHECRVTDAQMPGSMQTVARAQDEPYGGVPTVAYGHLFATARQKNIPVVLDGQGMDEQWAGYDYYATSRADNQAVQGSRHSPTREDLLTPALFDARRHRADTFPDWSGDRLLDQRLRDVLYTKLPRALRFNDRVSMMHSCELREPFLDHRLVELALAQPADRLIRGAEHKVLLRRIAAALVPEAVRTAAKRPVQTPQREWIAGPLSSWVRDTVNGSALYREWYRPGSIEATVQALRDGRTDNSFAAWQMLSLALWEPLLSPGN